MNPKERCLYALRQVRSALKAARKDRPPAISTTSIDDRNLLDQLIDSLESQTPSSSSVDAAAAKKTDSLIAQGIDFLSKEKSRTSSIDQSKAHELERRISDALDALRDYQKKMMADSSDHSSACHVGIAC